MPAPVGKPASRLETQEGPLSQFKSKGMKWLQLQAVRQEEFPLSPGKVSPFLSKPSTDWTRPTRVREDGQPASLRLLV